MQPELWGKVSRPKFGGGVSPNIKYMFNNNLYKDYVDGNDEPEESNSINIEKKL